MIHDIVSDIDAFENAVHTSESEGTVNNCDAPLIVLYIAVTMLVILMPPRFLYIPVKVMEVRTVNISDTSADSVVHSSDS